MPDRPGDPRGQLLPAHDRVLLRAGNVRPCLLDRALIAIEKWQVDGDARLDEVLVEGNLATVAGAQLEVGKSARASPSDPRLRGGRLLVRSSDSRVGRQHLLHERRVELGIEAR
jgi:hypothetical protein